MKLTTVILFAGQLVVFGAGGLGGTPLSPVISTPNTISVGGNVSAINSTLASAQSGDTVIVQAGTYFISNNIPVIIPTGVTLQGVYGKTIFQVDTNGPQDGRLDYSTFQATDNSTIRGITWLATNGWNTTTTLGPYASFLRSGPVYTNVLVEQCDIQGGSDVFYATNGGGFGTLTLRKNKITSYWDFNSGGSGVIISEGNIWNGLGASSRPSRFVFISTKFYDSGSVFIGFAGYDLGASQGTFGLHGSVMEFSPVEGISLWNSARTDLTGDYVDDIQGKSYSLTAERAGYVTNGFTTNINYFFNPTNNLYVTSGNPDANLNGTYVRGTGSGDFITGQHFYTNQSHITYVLWLNDPAAVSDEGSPPALSIRASNGSGNMIAEGAPPNWQNALSGSGVSIANIGSYFPMVIGDGSSSCGINIFTNLIVTNAIANLQPSIFLGKVSWVSNAFFQIPNISSQKSNAVASVAISFPNTTVNWTNTQGFNIVLYIDNAGVTGTVTKKNGQQIYSALVGDVVLALKPGDYFSETYTVGTPSGRWEPQ